MDLMIVEIFNGENWEKDPGEPFGGIKIGSIFRLRNPHTKELFVGDNGKTEFEAISEPYISKDGIWTVNIKEDQE